MAHPAELYQELPDGKVRCTACARYCTVPSGSHGFCFVRKNEGGKLELLSYGTAAAIQVDPIEKKPLSHFHPGVRMLSIGTVGCNWRCQYCQNAEISQEHLVRGQPLSPAQAARMAVEMECAGLTFTYNEPTIFAEYAMDIAKAGHTRGLFTSFVTNGYMTPEVVEYIAPHLDAVTVDFKGSGEEKFMRKYISAKGPAPIRSTLADLQKRGVHVEVTNLVVPEVGDDPDALRELATFVHDELGADVAFHLLRFHPDYRMLDLPITPIRTLESLHAIAKEVGLEYVYIGNVWGHRLEHTYCPACGAVAVDRFGFAIRAWNLDELNQCNTCGHPIPIVGRLPADYEPLGILPLA